MSLLPLHDDRILTDMRRLMQNYAELKRLEPANERQLIQLQQRFEELHRQLCDPILKRYSYFEYLEKLYSAS